MSERSKCRGMNLMRLSHVFIFGISLFIGQVSASTCDGGLAGWPRNGFFLHCVSLFTLGLVTGNLPLSHDDWLVWNSGTVRGTWVSLKIRVVVVNIQHAATYLRFALIHTRKKFWRGELLLCRLYRWQTEPMRYFDKTTQERWLSSPQSLDQALHPPAVAAPMAKEWKAVVFLFNI